MLTVCFVYIFGFVPLALNPRDRRFSCGLFEFMFLRRSHEKIVKVRSFVFKVNYVAPFARKIRYRRFPFVFFWFVVL